MSEFTSRNRGRTPCVPPGHVGITDPPPHRLTEWQQCAEHGPTVNVEWRSGERCPLCESYEQERALRDWKAGATGARRSPASRSTTR